MAAMHSHHSPIFQTGENNVTEESRKVTDLSVGFLVEALVEEAFKHREAKISDTPGGTGAVWAAGWARLLPARALPTDVSAASLPRDRHQLGRQLCSRPGAAVKTLGCGLGE